MNWQETINIKRYLDDSFTPEEAGKEISKLLLQSKFKDSLLQILCKELSSCMEVEKFDSILDDIYDWADRKKVWLGL